MAEFSTSIQIDAAPEEVFDFLVTEELLTEWMGRHATLAAHVGGEFSVEIAGFAVRGEYLAVDRPHRVVWSWGMLGVPGLPPGSSTVEFRLTPTLNGTRVDLTHSDLPDAHVDGHADGWGHFLARLRTAVPGGVPGPDHWTPTRGVPR